MAKKQVNLRLDDVAIMELKQLAEHMNASLGEACCFAIHTYHARSLAEIERLEERFKLRAEREAAAKKAEQQTAAK